MTSSEPLSPNRFSSWRGGVPIIGSGALRDRTPPVHSGLPGFMSCKETI